MSLLAVLGPGAPQGLAVDGQHRPVRGTRARGVGVLPPAARAAVQPDFRRPWADAGLLIDVAAGRPPHALARHVGTRPPHVACAHVGVSQPAGEKRPSARTPAGPGPRRSVAARPIAQARTRSRLICERRACAYQLRKPGLVSLGRSWERSSGKDAGAGLCEGVLGTGPGRMTKR